ncbi:bifunctional diguanylate cyclase/phosphodiesterase [Chitinimonas sp. BJYL2]|uniref:putative bifunctional diguanylate cyclase/phosphodiesterase n=1 Tax=Chitinimonas sp. BJYL2 TaxID=2976696 RepID=UPI0022B50654|nr:EAL domain-containing protein [Chitinimonas sp. BJYL2]
MADDSRSTLTLAQLQQKRIRQVLLLSLGGMVASCLHNLLVSNWPSVIALGVGLALLLWALWDMGQGRHVRATTVMLMTLTVMITTLIWIAQGVRDPALLAYPAILVFASLLGNRRLFLGLLATMIVAVAVVVTANIQGWHLNAPRPVRVGTFIDISLILAVTGATAWLLAGDLRRALAQLQQENARVVESQTHIEYLASHDALTGLPNRVLARSRFDQLVAQSRRDDHHVAMLYLDLDNFKSVNDSLGHLAGDDLLREVSQRLVAAVRGADVVCRLGGDEFLIVVGEARDSDAASAIACKLLDQLARPLQLDGLEVSVTTSIGVALFPEDGQDFDTLMKKADMAMYRAKDAGRNAFRFFDAAMNESVIEHLHLVSGMRQALQRGEFQLHYQPQFDLAAGTVSGAEALIRWQHPELGLIPPARFIPVAEKSGLIIEIGAWVLEEACRQTMCWQRDGLGDLTISVNLSPVQFRRDNVERLVLNALQASGLPANRLELELTESLLIEDSEHLSALLGRLRAVGVSFSIDDFGTGYSNLSYLKRFEVERLKIDQSFIRRLTEDTQDEAIVRAIIQMAGSLKLDTVAEGVEDADTLARILELGCHHGQGFYWSPALPAAQFDAFVRSRQPAASAATDRVAMAGDA